VVTQSMVAAEVVAISKETEFPGCTAKSVSMFTYIIVDPTDEGIAESPPQLKTASPSLIALPVIFTNPQNSSTASTEKDTVRFFMLDTFVGTVKELLTVAAPNADNAWNVPAVVVLCVTLLLIAIAIVFP